ncbi:ATPase [Micromonospora craterilacus]|uniref:ATPase n=1 Tax=Micromonospora craterilacus TaxID=1655439 RepID=A0A2W2EPB5_9ACTN|nr:SRPBCC family protein [Micromonospora craterilacus]PZG14258.1 ATPase [Micromonospora craterilacus]
MTHKPTGQLFGAGGGGDLAVTRTFRAPAEDVWASLTEPGRTARWFGPWEGAAAPGASIRVQMAFEEGTPWSEVRIDACEPPRRLALSMRDESGDWRMELLLTERGDRTELRFVHHLDDVRGIGEVGPGWEYYLDRLVAAREDAPMPSFDDYYPAMKAYFEGLRATR